MKAIIAINSRNYIGKDGKIMWNCPEDLAHFKKLTMGCTLLVGYNTFQNLPYLKGRTIILDDKSDVNMELIKMSQKLPEWSQGDKLPVWCIGGKKTYEKYAPYFTELHISFINNDEFGDVLAPDFKNLNENCKIFHYFFGF